MMSAMAGAITADSTVRISPRVYARAFGEEMVLLDFGLGEYFGLDPVGADVWRGLEAGEPVSQIVDGIVARYDVTREAALADVLSLLAELRDSSLIETITP